MSPQTVGREGPVQVGSPKGLFSGAKSGLGWEMGPLTEDCLQQRLWLCKFGDGRRDLC